VETGSLDELKKKVDWLCKELYSAKKENIRLNRLLLAAESRIKKLAGGNGAGGAGLTELTGQITKLKTERRMIKAKVEKLVGKLDKFYGD